MIARREFITLLGGAAVAWPLAARAQQTERVRRIGILLPAAADDVGFQAPFGAFLQTLALLGWTIGRNVRIDTRWATPNAAEIRRHAAELVALAPDVILASGTSTVGPLLQARTVARAGGDVCAPVSARLDLKALQSRGRIRTTPDHLSPATSPGLPRAGARGGRCVRIACTKKPLEKALPKTHGNALILTLLSLPNWER